MESRQQFCSRPLKHCLPGAVSSPAHPLPKEGCLPGSDRQEGSGFRWKTNIFKICLKHLRILSWFWSFMTHCLGLATCWLLKCSWSSFCLYETSWYINSMWALGHVARLTLSPMEGSWNTSTSLHCKIRNAKVFLATAVQLDFWFSYLF